MPPRWLLPKTRVSHDESRVPIAQPSKTETVQTPKWGEFCFLEESASPIRNTQEEERPRTSSGVSGRERSKSKIRPQIGLTLARPKTSEGRPPSKIFAGYSPSRVDDGMIGVAFGSPTHPPMNTFGTLNDLAPPSSYEDSVFEQVEPMYQVKGRTSKWKKLGFLFKGGKAAADKADVFEVPFYKVRVEDESPEMEQKARKSPTPPPKDDPRRSIDARLAQARQEVARLEEVIAEAEKKAIEQSKESPNDASRPKLDLVIPDIQLDRYSVMFADFKEIPLDSKLLARRSKKLDHLKPISTEDMKQVDDMATPDTSTLSPRLALPRRATSPSAAKTTAGFSLFPALASMPFQPTKHALTAPSPRPHLRRSLTSPARLSPRTGKPDTKITNPMQSPQAESANAVISPGDTTASTDREAPWSAKAFLSPTSTITTIDEDVLLELRQDIGKNTKEAPKMGEHYLDANEAQHMQFLASPTLPQDIGETPEATTPVMTIDPSQEDDYKIQRVASSVFDQAIAEIEAFGVPSLQDQLPSPSLPSVYVPLLLAADETKPAPQKIEILPPAISKSRLMMMNMPSPIREALEESPAPSPAKPTCASQITTQLQIPEPQRPPPPTPVKLDMLAKKAVPAALPSPILELSQESPKVTPEKKPKAQPKSVPRDMKQDTQAKTILREAKPDVQLKPVPREAKPDVQAKSGPKEMKQDIQLKHIPREVKQDVQASPAKQKPQFPLPQNQDVRTSRPKHAPRSSSRQKTSNEAARVMSETLPGPQHHVATIVGRPADVPKSPADSPPAVPTKDSKFVIPVSRWAVKGTTAESIKRSGLKTPKVFLPPAKPVRSATEPLTATHMENSYPKLNPSRLVRSVSDESLQKEITNPAAKDSATSNLERMGMERPSVMTVTAVIRPAPVPAGGEVGVARTISLSRKPSQRILVKRTDNIRDTSPEAREELVKKLQARNELQMMPPPPRSLSRPKGPMGNLKRSESFKRAIEVGMEDEDEGDMRSGELRARAMSPEMRQVTTGLVVNGHKVMKSSAGIIEQA